MKVFEKYHNLSIKELHILLSQKNDDLIKLNEEKKNSYKKEKLKQNDQNKNKPLSPDMLYNIPIITCSNEKKETKDDKMLKEYSVQEEK